MDNRTSEHSTSLLPKWGAIASRYYAMGEQKSHLGHSLGPVRSVGSGSGTSVRFSSGGRIYQRKGTNTAYSVRASVTRAMISTGSIEGYLGYPNGHEYVSTSGGLTQRFQKGAVSGPTRSRVFPVYGVVWDKWQWHKRAAGRLGYPTSARISADGGWVQHFEGGAATKRTWGSALTVVEPWISAWRAADAEDGVLGLPTRDVTPTSRGSNMRFAGGQMWRLGSGTPRRVTGPVLEAWLSERGHVGRYGYPVTDTKQRSDGRWQCTFEGGTIVA